MAESTLSGEIRTLVRSEANNNPAPELCKVVGNYSDSNYVDVETDNGVLKYIPCLFSNEIGNTGVVVYCNGDLKKAIALIDNKGGDIYG